MLLLCSRRHIGRRFWFPGEVWVVPLVGVVGIVVWGCGWWLVLAYCIGLFSYKVLTKGTLGQCSPWCSVD